MGRATPFVSGLLCLVALSIPYFGALLLWTDSYRYGWKGLLHLGLEPPQVAATTSMLVGSFGLGWRSGRRVRHETWTSYRAVLVRVAHVFLGSWLIFLFTLLLADLSPLCIGRDNGDGNNTLQDCAGYSVIGTFFYSALMIVPFGISALITAQLWRALTRRCAFPHLSTSGER